MREKTFTVRQIYSCRAELQCDAIRFLFHAWEAALNQEDHHRFLVNQFTTDPPRYGDCELEFETTLPVVTLLELLDLVPDSHVMRQTLRLVPLAENSLERDWDATCAAQPRRPPFDPVEDIPGVLSSGESIQ